MKENKKSGTAMSRRAVLTGGAIAAASLAIPPAGVGATNATDCPSCNPTQDRTSDELLQTHREFLLLWILLTQGASTYVLYSAAGNTKPEKIICNITADVRQELQNSAWYWPNLCSGLAQADRCSNKDAAFKLASDIYAAQQIQANGKGVYEYIEKNLKDNSPNNPPWSGTGVHPGIHAIVTALGIH